MRALIIAFGLPLLAACTTPGERPREGGYSAFDTAQASCRERGGILTPTGRFSGRPQTDYACTITGNVSTRSGVGRSDS